MIKIKYINDNDDIAHTPIAISNPSGCLVNKIIPRTKEPAPNIGTIINKKIINPKIIFLQSIWQKIMLGIL